MSQQTTTTNVIREVIDHASRNRPFVVVRARDDDEGNELVEICQGTDVVWMSIAHANAVAVALNELLDELEPAAEDGTD
ncbi:hypothetical protein [Sphingomonas sp. ACRSK]|uniref:hypothetical protein n=1 Tax=Sphingomonas sp. ACRSK TaxID=2918213 RepID=UPI001EF722EA|nr:hypothetical protein [Sphingomonas sp. ACRSK]MCG7349232.1 hypothetical protein [Sphingomonas sp. ACRSK]